MILRPLTCPNGWQWSQLVCLPRGCRAKHWAILPWIGSGAGASSLVGHPAGRPASQPPPPPTFLCPQLPSTPERTTSQTRRPRHSTPDRPLDNRHSTGPGWGPALPTGTGQALAVTPFALGQAPRLAAPRFPGPSLHQAVRPTPAPWLRRCSGAWVTRARLPHRAQPAPSKFPQAGPPPAHLPLACPPRAPGPHPEPHPRSSSR